MDATPEHRMLLRKRPLKAAEQVSLGIEDVSMFSSKRISSAALPKLNCSMLVRNLDELRRLPEVREARQFTPLTPLSSDRFPDVPDGGEVISGDTSSSVVPSDGANGSFSHLVPLEDHGDYEDAAPWERPEGITATSSVPRQATSYVSPSSLWSWPMEVLYQKYHLVIAIDVSRSMFDSSRTGEPFFDRTPMAMEAIIQSVRAVLDTRAEECDTVRRWATTNLPSALHGAVTDALWNPLVDISVVLVNVPHRAAAVLRGRHVARHSSDYTSTHDEDEESEWAAGGGASTAAVPSHAHRSHPDDPLDGGRGGDGRGRATATGGAAATGAPSRWQEPSTGLPTTTPSASAGRRDSHSGGSKSAAPRRSSASGLSSTASNNINNSNAQGSCGGVPPSPVPLFPLHVHPFGSMDDSYDFSVERILPLLLRCDATAVLQDDTLLDRVAEALRFLETQHRSDTFSAEWGDGEWPDASVSETLERVLRIVPADAPECHSVCLLSNFAVNGVSETVAFLESAVLRRSVIVTCFSLNRFVPWESPHILPFAHFLASAGGCAVQVDQWAALAVPSLSVEWCRRFEGPRCLAQQLFVQLVSKFPVVSPCISQRAASLIPNLDNHPYLLEVDLPLSQRSGGDAVVIPSNGCDAHSVIRLLAAARLNEGWSVVVDTVPLSNPSCASAAPSFATAGSSRRRTAPAAAAAAPAPSTSSSSHHLYAKLDHFLHKGSLTVYYEVDLVGMMLYRRLRVQGTPSLVRQLANTKLDDKVRRDAGAPADVHVQWHTYVSLLRGLLDQWMQADDDLFALIAGVLPPGAKAAASASALSVVTAASRLQGYAFEWLNRCTVRSSVLLVSLSTATLRDRLFLSDFISSSHSKSKRATDGLVAVGKEVLAKAVSELGYFLLGDGLSGGTGSHVPLVCCHHCSAGAGSEQASRSGGTAVSGFDILQLFAVNDGSSTGELLATAFEVRRSSFRFGGACVPEDTAFDSWLLQLNDALRRVTKDSAASSSVATSAPPKASHSLLGQPWQAAAATPCSSSAAAQVDCLLVTTRPQDTLAVVKRSLCLCRNDLLSMWSDLSGSQSSAAPTRQSGTGNSSRGGQHAQNRRPKIAAKHTVMFAAQQRTVVVGSHDDCLLCMPATATFRWCFPVLLSGRSASFVSLAMGYLALRRMDSGCRVVHVRGGGRKCVFLRRRRHSHVEATVHDVLEVEMGEGVAEFRVVRHVSHVDVLLLPGGASDAHEHIRSFGHSFLGDVELDFVLLTTLFSATSAFNRKLHQAASCHCVSLADYHLSHLFSPHMMGPQGWLGATIAIEHYFASVVGNLDNVPTRQRRYAAPEALGVAGTWELQRALFHFVSSCGDESILVPASSAPRSIWEALVTSASEIPNDGTAPTRVEIPLPVEDRSRSVSHDPQELQQQQVLTVVLYPRHASVPVLLVLWMLCPPPRPRDTSPVVLLSSFVDVGVVVRGLSRRLHCAVPIEVLDHNGSRARVAGDISHTTVAVADDLLASTVDHCIEAFANCVNARSLQRELLRVQARAQRASSSGNLPPHNSIAGRGGSSESAPVSMASTPTMDTSSMLAFSADAVLRNSAVLPRTETSSDVVAAPCISAAALGLRPSYEDLENAFRPLATYTKTVDISFLYRIAARHGGAPYATAVVEEALGMASGNLRPVMSAPSPTFFLDANQRVIPATSANDAWEASQVSNASSSSSSRDSGGIVRDMGALEPDHVPCLCKIVLTHSSPIPSSAVESPELTSLQTAPTMTGSWIGGRAPTLLRGDDDESKVTAPPFPPDCRQGGSIVLAPSEETDVKFCKGLMVLCVRTLPDSLFDLSRNRFRPSTHVIRKLIADVLGSGGEVPQLSGSGGQRASADFSDAVVRSYTSAAAAAAGGASGVPPFFARGALSDGVVRALCDEVPLSRLPEQCLAVFEALIDEVHRGISERAMLDVLSGSAWHAVQQALVEAEINDESSGVIGGNSVASSTTTPDLLRHRNVQRIVSAAVDSGLSAVCEAELLPALRATSCGRVPFFHVSEFVVELPRLTRAPGSSPAASTSAGVPAKAGPTQSTRSLVAQVLSDEGVCLVAVDQASGFLVIPPAAACSSGVVFVEIDRPERLHECTLRIFAFAPSGSTFPVAPVCAQVRQLIYDKVAQLCQQNLLRELRDRQNAPEELIPPHWGDQFSFSAPPPPVAVGLRTATFLPAGRTVAEIPLYYRIQGMARKVYSRILTNCFKLELLPIYNQEQCFVVSDDVATDTVHFVRLIFVKTASVIPHPNTQFPTPVGSDRCQLLVIQLYAATKNPSIQSAIDKVRDYCYLLAIQELQSQLNFVQRKDLQPDDWTFLRSEKRDTITAEMTTGGTAWHVMTRELAKWFLIRNLQECKFKLIASGDALLAGVTTANSFLAHYQLTSLRSATEADSFSSTSAACENSAAEPSLSGSATGSAASQHQSSPNAIPAAADSPATATASTPSSWAPTSASAAASAAAEDELRFVKQLEGLTEVIWSCSIRFTSGGSADDSGGLPRIVADVFCTRPVHDQAAAHAETMSSMTRGFQTCLNETVLQVNFFIGTQRTTPAASIVPKIRPLHVKNAPAVIHHLLSLADESTAPTLSILRRRVFDTRHLSLAHLGTLLERITGLLQPLRPSLLVYTPTERRNPTNVLPGFTWAWLEALQDDVLVERQHFLIACGFRLEQDGEILPPTRAHSARHPTFDFSRTSCVETIRAQLDIAGNSAIAEGTQHSEAFKAINDTPKVLVHVHLREGIRCVVFNLKDSEQLTTILELLVNETLKKSALHRDVLLQSLGLHLTPAFTERQLAVMCCGDQRNTQEQKPLHIEGESLHRASVTSRFPVAALVPADPKAVDRDEAYAILVAGLANRGTMVNHVFPYDAAVKVLFDDSGVWSLKQCTEVLQRLISEGVFVADETPIFGLQSQSVHHAYDYVSSSHARPLNYRITLPHARTVPTNTLIANVYHRHLQRAHILLEARNARSTMSERISRFEEAWLRRQVSPPALLVRHMIQLQLKSKQVYGSRVPEFSLRIEDDTPGKEPTLEDMLLEPNIPTMLHRDLDYCRPVDRILRQYVQHLSSVFPLIHVIDVDPAAPEFSNDPEISKRLRCRYAKLHNPRSASAGGAEAEYVTFTPHLYFAVMSTSQAAWCLRAQEAAQRSMHSDMTSLLGRGEQPPSRGGGGGSTNEAAAAQPLPEGGFFVIEIGFQVVNYALDFFMVHADGPQVHGGSISASDFHVMATQVKQKFLFSSVLYDLAVHRLMSCVQQFAGVLPGEQPLNIALQNLMKYYPTPPSYSLNAAHAFSLHEPSITALQAIMTRLPVGRAAAGNNVHFLVPPSAVLRRETTQELYSFSGVLVYSATAAPLLYVMMATERDAAICQRVRQARDIAPLLAEAKAKLLRHLLGITLPWRVQAVWERLASATHDLTLEDYQLMLEFGTLVDRSDQLSEFRDSAAPNGLALSSPVSRDGSPFSPARGAAVSSSPRHCCAGQWIPTLLSWDDLQKQLPISAERLAANGVALRSVSVSSTEFAIVAVKIQGSAERFGGGRGPPEPSQPVYECGILHVLAGATQASLCLHTCTKSGDDCSANSSNGNTLDDGREEAQTAALEALCELVLSATWNSIRLV